MAVPDNEKFFEESIAHLVRQIQDECDARGIPAAMFFEIAPTVFSITKLPREEQSTNTDYVMGSFEHAMKECPCFKPGDFIPGKAKEIAH